MELVLNNQAKDSRAAFEHLSTWHNVDTCGKFKAHVQACIDLLEDKERDLRERWQNSVDKTSGKMGKEEINIYLLGLSWKLEARLKERGIL